MKEGVSVEFNAMEDAMLRNKALMKELLEVQQNITELNIVPEAPPEEKIAELQNLEAEAAPDLVAEAVPEAVHAGSDGHTFVHPYIDLPTGEPKVFGPK